MTISFLVALLIQFPSLIGRLKRCRSPELVFKRVIWFPSLIGRLKSREPQAKEPHTPLFPSLIGRLKSEREIHEELEKKFGFPSLIGRLKR